MRRRPFREGPRDLVPGWASRRISQAPSGTARPEAHVADIAAPRPGPAAAVTLLGHPGPLRWRYEGGRLRVAVPALSPDGALRHAYAFRLTGVS